MHVRIINIYVMSTKEAAREHSFRTYHQVQTWNDNQKNPEEWGWQRTQLGLTPVTTTKDPAPEALLKFISCKCKTGCASKCGCRKAGLKCSIICSFCNGNSCENVAEVLADSEEEEEENEDVIQLTEIFEEFSASLGEEEEEEESGDEDEYEKSDSEKKPAEENIHQPGPSRYSKRLKQRH